MAVVAGLYLTSYLILTLQGVYGWGAIGGSGVKWWEWYPKGFGFENPQHSDILRLLYRPLHRLDLKFWHNERTLEKIEDSPVFHGFPP